MFSLKRACTEDLLGIIDLMLLVNGDTEDLKPEEFLVAKDINNNLLGCGRLKHYASCIEVASIAVYPEYRKIGIARNIVQNLVEQTKNKLYLVCEKSLMSFFEKFGFKVYSGLIHQNMLNKYNDTFKLYNFNTRVMVREPQ